MQKMTKKIMTAQIRLILGFKNISSNLIISEINEWLLESQLLESIKTAQQVQYTCVAA